MSTALSSIYSAFLVPQPDIPGVRPIDEAREYLGMSIEDYGIVTTPDSSEQSLSRYYGFNDISKHLPYQGAGKISFTSGKRLVQSDNTGFRRQFAKGDQIKCGDEIRTVDLLGTGTVSFSAGSFRRHGT